MSEKVATPLPEGSVAGIHFLRNGGVWGRAPLIIRKAVLCAILCAVIVVIAAIVIPNQNNSTAPYYYGGDDMYRNRRISASEAKDLMTRYPNAIILDVRTEHEFQLGHIPGAILLPDFDIQYMAASILCDYNALILVYCQSGNRSRGATELLVSMGYRNVYDFGGISTWPYGRQ